MSKENFNVDLSALTKHIPITTLDKADDLYMQGAVTNLRILNDRIYANVQGTYLYKVELVDDGEIEAFCTCPAAEIYPVCKHAIAAAYAFLNLENKDSEDLPTVVNQRKLAEDYFMTLDKKEVVGRLIRELTTNTSKWNALMTQLSFKNFSISFEQMRNKIQTAFPEIEHDYDGWNSNADYEYFSNASEQLAPLWGNLNNFTLDQQWDLLVMIWNTMNEVYPCFHYGDQSSDIEANLENFIPKIFQSLPWTEQEKMTWLMDYVVIKDDDEYLSISHILLEHYESNPLLIELCKERLNSLPAEKPKWRYAKCAEIVENNAKDWREILAVKMQMNEGLNDCLDICQFYLKNGEALDAEYFLAQTRKKFTSDREQKECDRVEIKIRTRLGEKKQAWRIAKSIFAHSPSYQEFQTLLLTQTGLQIEDEDLLTSVEKQLVDTVVDNRYRADDVLEFYIFNKEFDKGMQWLKKYQIDSDLKLAFFEKAVDKYPQETAIAFVEAAEKEVARMGKTSYPNAINMLLKAEKMLLLHENVLPLFYQKVVEISKKHKAKRNFIALFNTHFAALSS